MDGSLGDLVSIAFHSRTLLIAGAIYMILRGIRSTKLASYSVYQRALPVLPETIGSIISAFGAIPAVADETIVVKIAAGLWCGYLAQRFHKVLGQTILGDDREIVAASAALSVEDRT